MGTEPFVHAARDAGNDSSDKRRSVTDTALNAIKAAMAVFIVFMLRVILHLLYLCNGTDV